MLLKRKRSECELSYGSIFSSTQQLNNDCFNFDAMAAAETARRGFFSQRHSTPSHLHSRTMKRSRDNRPAESDVYRKSNHKPLGLPTFAYSSHHCPQNTPWISSTLLSTVRTSPTMRSPPRQRVLSRLLGTTRQLTTQAVSSGLCTASGTCPDRRSRQAPQRSPPPRLPPRFHLRLLHPRAYPRIARTAA